MKRKLFVLLAVLALILCVSGCSKGITKMSYPTDFKSIVLKYSRESKLNPYLVYGIIKRESKFVHEAESSKGAVGLMQITESTAKWTAEHIGMEGFEAENLDNPELNIKLGCAYFSYLVEEYDGNCELALCAYNAGMGNVNSWLEEGTLDKNSVDVSKIPYEETRKYVSDVLSYKEKYEELYPDLV